MSLTILVAFARWFANPRPKSGQGGRWAAPIGRDFGSQARGTAANMFRRTILANGSRNDDCGRNQIGIQILINKSTVDLARPVNNAPDAGAQQQLVILHVGGVSEHLDVVDDCFVDRRSVDVLAQPDTTAPLQIPVVDPDLENPNPLGRLGAYGLSCVLGRGGFVEPVTGAPPASVVGKIRVRTAARRPQSRLGNVARPADFDPRFWSATKPIDSRSDAVDTTVPDPVVSVAVQVIDQVLAREVLTAPARIRLPSEMRVRVHDGRHDGLASHIHDNGIGRHRHLSVPSDLRQQAIANEEGGIVEDPAIADDNAGTTEEQGAAIVLRSDRLIVHLDARGGAERQERNEAHQSVHGDGHPAGR